MTGPLGEPVICEYGIVEEKTAIIEMAGAAGSTLVQPKLRNPLNTTTYGVGEVIKDAIGKGCRHFNSHGQIPVTAMQITQNSIGIPVSPACRSSLALSTCQGVMGSD